MFLGLLEKPGVGTFTTMNLLTSLFELSIPLVRGPSSYWRRLDSPEGKFAFPGSSTFWQVLERCRFRQLMSARVVGILDVGSMELAVNILVVPTRWGKCKNSWPDSWRTATRFQRVPRFPRSTQILKKRRHWHRNCPECLWTFICITNLFTLSVARFVCPALSAWGLTGKPFALVSSHVSNHNFDPSLPNPSS